MELLPGTVKAIYNNQRSNPLFKNPVLQITGLVKMQVGETDKPRYKANVSDGRCYMKAVFSSELNQLFDKENVGKFSLVRISLFTLRPKENTNYLYVQTISEHESRSTVIGNPVNILTGKPSSEPSPGTESGIGENSTNLSKGGNVMRDDPPPASRIAPPPKRSSINSEDSKRTKCTLIPIKELNPFLSKWIVKGRVMAKSDLKTFTSSRGEGKVFSFEISDGTAQVKVVAFSQHAETFYPMIELNRVYTISQGVIKMANRKFTSNNFDYEIQLDKGAEVVAVQDESIPQYHFEFVKIADLAVGGSLVDFVGVVKEVFPVSLVKAKNTGNDLSKRELTMVDETGVVRLTIWGKKAEEEYSCEQVMCIKALKVGEYNGITLSTTSSSQILTECDIPEAIKVYNWYTVNKNNIKGIERPKGRSDQVKLIGELKTGGIEFASVHVTVMFLKEDNVFYESCLSEGCGRKVSSDEGKYRCEKCNCLYDKCGYRYMLAMHVGDFTGQVWVTLFDEAAQSILGIKAVELKEIGENDPAELQRLMKSVASRHYMMRMRVREDVYNGEPRLKFSCIGQLQPWDYNKEAKKMLDVIQKIS